MAEFDREQIQEIADRAADKAVTQLFRALGVDVQDQKDLNDLRSDLIYSRRLRRLTESTGSKAWVVMVALISVGALTFLWDAIKRAAGIE